MTILTPNVLETTLLVDNTTGLITPGNLRTMSASLSGLASTTVSSTAATTVLTDRGTRIRVNSATAANVTIPQNVYDVDTVIQIFQAGVGQVTIVAGAGVTLLAPGSLSTRARYSSLVLQQDSANVWIVSGDSA